MMYKSTFECMKELLNHLNEHFDSSGVLDLNAVIALDLRDSEVAIWIRLTEGACDVSTVNKADRQTPTWTIYIRDETTALALLRSEVNPVDLFMQKKLASSGYIVTTFRLLRAFTCP